MKRTLALLFAVILYQAAFAQELSIRGKVITSSHIPVEYATVILQDNDSTFVNGCVTDLQGAFALSNLKAGNYRLAVSSVGYQSKYIPVGDFSRSLNLGELTLDSAAIALDEVTVTASHVINQADRKILFPTAHQMKASVNGLDLLQQMQLSRIHVDPFNRKITASGGGDVQLRINGAKAELEEVLALRPEDILRIEHHDDPGLRYGNAAAVIDYITRRKERGGYISLDTRNSPHVSWGSGQLTAKYNHKRSEFTAYYNYGYRSFHEMWRENTETFNDADGIPFTRKEDGNPDDWRIYWHFIGLSYNYQKPESYFLNIALRGNFHSIPENNFNSRLYPAGNPENSVDMVDNSSNRQRIPALDIYYQRTLKNKQMLILNVVGTYINTLSEREYTEKKDNELLTEIFSRTRGDKYSLIGEGIYEKSFGSSKLSFGVRHTQSFADNDYTGTNITQTNMKQSDTYAYAEYQQKISKFNYSVGVGGNRSWFKQSGEGYQDYTFRPTLRMTYNFSDKMFIRYRGTIYSNAPSLGSLSETEQLIDSLQIRRGNPHLKPYTTYSNTLYYDMRQGLFNLNLNLAYYYQRKPIMEQTLLDDKMFIRTEDNQKSWQKLNPELQLKFGPIKDILTLSLTTGVNYYDSRGLNYHHTYTNWYYEIEAMANYKKWSAMFIIQSHNNNFYGETLQYGERVHGLFLTYRHKRLSCGLMCINPFVDNWKIGNENRSALASSKYWRYLKESSRMFALTLTYNFSFGRKYESASRRLNNQDTDSGVLGGGK